MRQPCAKQGSWTGRLLTLAIAGPLAFARYLPAQESAGPPHVSRDHVSVARTFNRNVWTPVGGVTFVRRAFSGLLQYYRGDDCSDCMRTLVGLRLGARVGSRIIFLGPDVWLGVVSDERHGSDVGALLDLLLKVVIGFGH